MFLYSWAFAIEFSVYSGKQVCFSEDLPSQSSLKGIYGIASEQLQPDVEIVISADSQLLFNSTIKSNETFRIITQAPGLHQICFRDTTPET